MTAQALSRDDRRGIRDHIGHLISVRAVPALGTSLFVVSAYLHAHRGRHSRGRGRYTPISIFAIVARLNITKWTRKDSVRV